MGRWYPEPFEFMPCRTVLRNTHRRGDDTSVAANGLRHAHCTLVFPANTRGLLECMRSWYLCVCVASTKTCVHGTHVYLTRTRITRHVQLIMLRCHFYRISIDRSLTAAVLRMTAET